MAEKDITEKNLEALNDVFADIVNVLLFKGEQVIKEKELEADITKSMFKADGKIHEQERDVSKFWKNGEIRNHVIFADVHNMEHLMVTGKKRRRTAN